jgi:hypothetical protein
MDLFFASQKSSRFCLEWLGDSVAPKSVFHTHKAKLVAQYGQIVLTSPEQDSIPTDYVREPQWKLEEVFEMGSPSHELNVCNGVWALVDEKVPGWVYGETVNKKAKFLGYYISYWKVSALQKDVIKDELYCNYLEPSFLPSIDELEMLFTTDRIDIIAHLIVEKKDQLNMGRMYQLAAKHGKIPLIQDLFFFRCTLHETYMAFEEALKYNQVQVVEWFIAHQLKMELDHVMMALLHGDDTLLASIVLRALEVQDCEAIWACPDISYEEILDSTNGLEKVKWLTSHKMMMNDRPCLKSLYYHACAKNKEDAIEWLSSFPEVAYWMSRK